MASRRAATENLVIVGDYKVSFIDINDDITFAQYNENEDLVLTGHQKGLIKVFKQNKFQWEFSETDILNASVTCMKHRPLSKNFPVTNTVICSYSNGLVKSWNYNFKEIAFSIPENRYTTSVTYHPKLAKFITMGDDAKIFLYDEDSKRQERVLNSSDNANVKDGHLGNIICASFHPKSVNELITGGADNTLLFWDTRQRHALKCIEGVHLIGEGIDFNQKGTEFVSCSSDGDKSIRIWDYGSGKEIKHIQPDKQKLNLTCGRYINLETLVCAGGEPNLLRIVDLQTDKTVASVGGVFKPIINLDLAEESNKIELIFSAGKKVYNVVSSK